jgi:hypothetical protein
MGRPNCILVVSYCNFILEIDKEKNLKHWKTNAPTFYDKENRKNERGAEKENHYRNKKTFLVYAVNVNCGWKTCWLVSTIGDIHVIIIQVLYPELYKTNFYSSSSFF